MEKEGNYMGLDRDISSTHVARRQRPEEENQAVRCGAVLHLWRKRDWDRWIDNGNYAMQIRNELWKTSIPATYHEHSSTLHRSLIEGASMTRWHSPVARHNDGTDRRNPRCDA